MTALKKGMIAIVIGIGLMSITKWHRPDMTVVYPDNCTFTIDHFFSRPMQLEIKKFIDEAYKKNKSPSNLLPRIESHFPAIKSVVIDMQNPEILNFSIQSYRPTFLLNNEHVVCQHGKMLEKKVFASKELDKLENVSFDEAPTPKRIERLNLFFNLLTDPILKSFSVRWIDKHAIWLDQKEGLAQDKDLSLLVGYDFIPNQHDVTQCQKLRGQVSDKPCKDKRGRPRKNNTTWVCDLRFDQQIVLFSTNKGV